MATPAAVLYLWQTYRFLQRTERHVLTDDNMLHFPVFSE